MFRTRGLLFLLGTILLIACNATAPGEPAATSSYQEVPTTPLAFEEPDPAVFAGPGIPGCALADLRPFNWKLVDSGLVDIRSGEEYAIQTASLYQEGYLDYQQAQVESPERYGSVPQMSYEEFLATCDVFPAVDFTRHSLLGMDETGTGCTVSFERRVFREDEKKRIVFQLTVVEEGACETTVRDRNLILVPRIPPDYGATFEYGATIMLPGRASRETDPRVTPETLRELVDGNNRFAFELFQAVAHEEGNLVFSPHSISTGLAMAYAGARGATSVQMADVLHYTLPQFQLHPALNMLNGQMTTGDDEGFELLIVNALWGQEGAPFRPEYLELMAADYTATMGLVNFQSETGRTAAGDRINRWVSDATGQRITNLVNPSLFTELTRLVLTNAIAFDGLWASPFDDTANAAFTLSDGSRVTVPLMQRYATITPYASGDGWQSAKVAYQGERAYVLILLPAEGHFEAFAEDLDVKRLAEIEAALAPTDLVLFLPRVAYGTDLSLAETLADMGMTLAFSERQANFTGMGEIPPGLYISNVLHKAYVSMNELGTEAAAATAVEVAEGSEETLPVIMRVDRPFIFVIRDAEQGAILFMGRVVNPTVR